MNWRQRLKSPMSLALQGFAAGALLFFTFHPLASDRAEAPPPSEVMDISVPA